MSDRKWFPRAVEHMSRPTAEASERLRVLMICAHEPTMDPRIRWEAEGAARWFDVTVLGFANENRPRSDAPDADDYVTVRLGWREVSPLEYILHLRTIISTPVQVAIALTLFLSWPLLFVCEIGFRIVRQIGRLITVSLPFRIARSVLRLGWHAPDDFPPRRIRPPVDAGRLCAGCLVVLGISLQYAGQTARRSLQRSRYVAGGSAG